MKTRLQRRLDWTYIWCAILAVNYASFIKPQLFFPEILHRLAAKIKQPALAAGRHCLENAERVQTGARSYSATYPHTFIHMETWA